MRPNQAGWSLVCHDGLTVDFASHEEADTARWQSVTEQGFNTHAAVRAVIAQAERNAQAGREFYYEFSPEEMTAGRAIEQGLATSEQLGQRQEIARTIGVEDREFDSAQARAQVYTQSPDDALMSSRILGMSKTEFKEGIYRSTIRLYQGATPLTVIEEKAESDAAIMMMEGRKDWLVHALRDVEAKTGSKLFRVNDDDSLTAQDIKEAWSHLVQSYFVGKSKKGNAVIAGKFRRYLGKLWARRWRMRWMLTQPSSVPCGVVRHN